MIKMAAMSIYGIKSLKNLVTRNQWVNLKPGMKHQRFKLIIFCLNDKTVLILTYFTARSNCATLAFKWLTVTMIDTLEIIASSDLEFGLLSKLNN